MASATPARSTEPRAGGRKAAPHERESTTRACSSASAAPAERPTPLRLVQALAAAGCSLQLCVSDSGILVLEHELEPGRHGTRGSRHAAFLERAGVDGRGLRARRPGGAAGQRQQLPDAVVVCPCSMSTAAHIALGTTRTLIHRVADVALKERRPLVVVPRETPLTQIHLRRLLELAEAGAVVLPAMPGFYSRPQTLEDAVDHVVGKVLTALGFEQNLFPPWDGGRR